MGCERRRRAGGEDLWNPPLSHGMRKEGHVFPRLGEAIKATKNRRSWGQPAMCLALKREELSVKSIKSPPSPTESDPFSFLLSSVCTRSVYWAILSLFIYPWAASYTRDNVKKARLGAKRLNQYEKIKRCKLSKIYWLIMLKVRIMRTINLWVSEVEDMSRVVD